VYTLDADMVVIAASVPKLAIFLREQGFKTEEHQHSLNVRAPASDLRIQFTTDERYQAFLTRCVDGDVLGLRVKVASVEDVAQGKLWAYADQRRRFSKRKKDELDLVRLAEAYPALKSLYPSELVEQIDRG
jgi:translation elongation factor EF-1alpha